VVAGALSTASCDRGLPHNLRRDIEWERDDFERASRAVDASAKAVENAIAASPELFQGTSAPEDWRSKLADARTDLERSQRDDAKLHEISRLDRASSRTEAEQLLGEARHLRDAAISEATSTEAAVSKWRHFAQNPREALKTTGETLSSIKAIDLPTLSGTVEKAERDWPAKKADLEARLLTLKDIAKAAEAKWDGAEAVRTQASGQTLAGPSLASLISLDDQLTRDRSSLASGVQELTDLAGQLYVSWDKILTDLEISHFGRENVFRERIKTVRTRLLDPATNRSEATDVERWISVPEASYRSVEKDIGMTLAHKDAGLYDFEAKESPQPPGFAYLAPVEQGSNRYGYWTHSGGQTVWSFLPEYLVLRELLRSHDYRPIYADEYRGFAAARAAGRTYYGGAFDAATRTRTPTYGTHGSFTSKNYATSRYVQSGGFRGSAYASNRDRSNFSAFRNSKPDLPHSNVAPGSSNTGKRFGLGAAPSSGRQFGRPGGLARSFGRRR
jgi:hypothetical protein